MKSPTAVSLFAGCGGSDLGLISKGFKVLWANDVWDLACETYKENIPNATITVGDIRGVKKFPKADLLVGCYPCQGFSQGGSRNPEDPRNYLYREFDRALRQIKPRAFIVENVGGMSFGDNKTLLNNQLRRYRAAGYAVKWQVLNAKDYGVPQNRRRIFIVGIKSSFKIKYEFPKPTHGPGLKKPYVSQRKAIGDLPYWPDDGYCPEALHWYYLSRDRRHKWKDPSACIVGNWRHVPLHPACPPLEKVDTDEWRFRRRGKTRRLTYRECALLQGFPRSWKWNRGNIRDRFQLIGNAVPPPLFAAVVGALPSLIWK